MIKYKHILYGRYCMNDALYNLGTATFWVLPLVIALFCINKIRKNRAEIRRLEEEAKNSRK